MMKLLAFRSHFWLLVGLGWLLVGSVDQVTAQSIIDPVVIPEEPGLLIDSKTNVQVTAFQLPPPSPNPYLTPDYQDAPGAALQDAPGAVYGNVPGAVYEDGPGATIGLSPEAERRALSVARDYERRARNYAEPGLGVKPFADYAPEGYYSLDYQEAPGAPLYQIITPPPVVTAEQLDELVIRGPLPGSFLVPGSRTAMRLSGFVRLGANYDFDAIGTPDLFVTRSITTPEEPAQNMNFSARPTRISLDTWTPSSINDWMIHTFIQFDFLSGNPPAVGSSSNPRLRFAFVDFGYFRVGQDATVFMDTSSFPRTADFQGPNGIVNSRQGLARVTLPITERIRWASAVEQPFSDITTGGQGTNVQDVPDFTSHLRYDNDRLHLQASTILRKISHRDATGDVQRETGSGINLSGNVHPWAVLFGTNPLRDANPSPLTRSRLILQYSQGTGIGRYLQDTSGIGMDAALNAAGDLEALDISGYVLGYEQWLARKWLLNFTHSNLQVDATDAMPGNTFAESDYVATGLWWIPVANASIGAEYLWGQRENIDGQRARAERIQTVFQYNF